MSPVTSAGVVVAMAAVAMDGVLPVVARAIAVAGGWTVLTLAVGVILLAVVPSTTRAIRDDVLERPDLAFATGFVVFFAPLVVAALPLFVTMYAAGPVVLAIGALVSVPALLLWAALLLVGGAFGVVAAGDRISRRFGSAEPSLGRSLAVGTAVVGASQLVPVFGVLVAMGLATLGTGAAVRRRFDADPGDGPIVGIDLSVDRDRTATVDWEPADSSGTVVWDSNATAGDSDAAVRSDEATRTGEIEGESGTFDLEPDATGDARRERATDSDAGPDHYDDGGTATLDGEATADDWEWDLETERDGNGDEREDEDGADDRRTRSEKR